MSWIDDIKRMRAMLAGLLAAWALLVGFVVWAYDDITAVKTWVANAESVPAMRQEVEGLRGEVQGLRSEVQAATAAVQATNDTVRQTNDALIHDRTEQARIRGALEVLLTRNEVRHGR